MSRHTASSFYIALMQQVGDRVEEAMEGKPFTGSPVPFSASGNLMMRMGLHEAGHAIVTWPTKAMSFIMRMQLADESRGSAGTLIAWHTHIARKQLLWDMLVTMLGGFVAERHFIGEADPYDSLDDLTAARVMAERLAQMSQEAPNVFPAPWRTPANNLPPYSIAALYAVPLMPDAARAIVAAHRHAYYLVRRDREPLRRLAARLCDGRALARTDLERLLGPRPAK